ncbi:unnamed protein product [Sphagnum balticum]
MRAFHSTSKLRRGSFPFKNVPLGRKSDINAKLFIPVTSVRGQSSSNSSVNPSQWRPHSLSSADFSESNLGASSIISKPKDEKHTAYIALGSNLGDRIDWIEKACNEMSARGIKVKRTSCLWETAPMYVIDQESFVNGACESIENALGRKKIIDKGPRNIDLDILLYDDQVIDHERVKVPHPSMYEREFVLRPLSE